LARTWLAGLTIDLVQRLGREIAGVMALAQLFFSRQCAGRGDEHDRHHESYHGRDLPMTICARRRSAQQTPERDEQSDRLIAG
jgi:hypothetical protein